MRARIEENKAYHPSMRTASREAIQRMGALPMMFVKHMKTRTSEGNDVGSDMASASSSEAADDEEAVAAAAAPPLPRPDGKKTSPGVSSADEPFDEDDEDDAEAPPSPKIDIQEEEEVSLPPLPRPHRRLPLPLPALFLRLFHEQEHSSARKTHLVLQLRLSCVSSPSPAYLPRPQWEPASPR